MRSVVDPSFPSRLRALRTERGLSLRELAKLVPCSHVRIHQLEQGAGVPSAQMAERLDSVLDASGELARPPGAYEAAGRLEYVRQRPRSIDLAAVDTLGELLAGHRRLEDAIGSAPLVAPVRAQLDAVQDLVRDAPDNVLRIRLVDVAAQWAQFAAWLCATTGDHALGGRLYLRAMEWASEAGNPHMVATVLSMRGHLAWVSGQTRSMVELSRAAQWQPASRGVRALAGQQEARGLAILGDAAAVDAKLDEAEQLAHEAAEHREDEPPWLYFYDPDFFAAQRALAHQYLGRHEQAVELLTTALDRLPAQIRGSDWIGWYVLRLAESYAAAGEQSQAATLLEEARQIADRAAAERLSGEIRQLAHQLGV
jgi:transcriptional regulator with XRE-family HTH domain